MCRKVRMSDGQRRRSPRISALDACNQNHQDQRQPSRIKRKFDNYAAANVTATSSVGSKLAKQVWKGRDSPQNEHRSTDSVEWRSQMVKENQNHDDDRTTTNIGKALLMPAKHVLELVLDTLQRRDTYEVFAEPVDPDEVEDYYEIIKEPMDFGTMRAKLHEGMYENLEQFEHDVFLIPENAMHFNSSTTIYFRQARAIHELAKKVFRALKTDPENFVLEFSGTRRRSMRKALSDAKDSRISTIAKSGTVGSGASSKRAMHSSSNSTFQRTTKKNPGISHRSSTKNFFNGSKGGTLSSFEAVDRRSTYCAWKSSLCNDKDSIDSTFYNSSKRLGLMNQGDISYKDSLMSYVKDLGPIAQMVAKRKLLEHHESNGLIRSENSAATQKKNGSLDAKTFRTFRDFAPGCRPFLKASNTIDLTEDRVEANGCRNSTPGKDKTDCRTTPAGKEKIDCGTTPAGKEKTDCGTTPAGQEKTDCSALGKEKTKCSAPGKEKTGCVTLTSRGGLMNAKKGGMTRNPVARDSNCSTSRSNNISYRDDNVRPVILALENYHSHVTEFKSRNKKSCIEPTAPLKRPRAAALGSCGEAVSSSLAQQRPQPLPGLNSQFTFDLPFLKARLNQMNVLGIGGELSKKRAAPFEKGGVGVINCTRQAESIGIKPPFLYNQSRTGPSLDSNLALQL